MSLYASIKEMRALSKQKIPFSICFMSYNSTTGKSEGIIQVDRVRLTNRQSEKFHKHAEIVEKYINLDTMEARQFYHPLLMSFNDKKIDLK